MARQPLVPFNVIRGAAVNVNAGNPFNTQLPIGPGIYEFWLRFNIALTAGTAAGPISEGILNWIRQIYFRTDKNEVIVDNLPARAMHKIAWIKAQTKPRYDEIAAASATYRVDVPIYLVDYANGFPEDTVLDTSRYDSMFLNIVTGPLTDLFTTPGTASVVVTLDIDSYQSKGRWSQDPAAHPVGYINYSARPMVDANSTTTINLEKATDQSIKRIYVHATTAGTAGLPFAGVNSDAVIDVYNLADGSENWVTNAQWDQAQDQNKATYSLENIPSGLVVVDFNRDKSSKGSLYAGDKSQLKLTWTNKAGVAANSYVTAAVESLRAFKAA